VFGGRGNDNIHGARQRLAQRRRGDDTVSGDANGTGDLTSSTIFGGSGNDTLNGGDSHDRISGGPGNDTSTARTATTA
jgi:Ca2+-binding RTX toxin-like protein